MLINANSDKPIFVQISEGIEDAIISGVFPEETQIPSTTEISAQYKINPATALKGINILVESGVIYKKRGVGMFVSQGATAKILSVRQKEFFDSYIKTLLGEAKKLNITKEEIIKMIERETNE
ncbi:MAG: GntR family transcriptional regulator [Ruminococcus sp.]|nr:GntR family transcriptional regulator [Ruminococcus sp.]